MSEGRSEAEAAARAEAGPRAILVHVEAGEEGERRLRLAARFARRFDAALTGLAALAIRPLVATPDGAMIMPMVVEIEEQQIAEELPVVRQMFDRVTAEEGISATWLSAIEFPTDALARRARSADLVIVGRPRGGLPDDYRSVDAGDLVMRAGRPVVVVPPDVAELAGRKVLVAWKDTREARRALADSLALLGHAESVLVAEYCPADDRKNAGQRLDDIERYLARHGIAARTSVETGDPETELGRLAAAHGIDLIVAGAYGHTRFRELVFGGVTRSLLRESPLPLFLSH